MAQKKAFPLRLDPDLYQALRRLADAEFRSMNAQIEYLLREAIMGRGMLTKKARGKAPPGPPGS